MDQQPRPDVPPSIASMQQLEPFVDARVPVAISHCNGTGCLVFDSPIAVVPGALVQLREGRTFLLGSTRSCCPKGVGFEVMLKVDDSYGSAASLGTTRRS